MFHPDCTVLAAEFDRIDGQRPLRAIVSRIYNFTFDARTEPVPLDSNDRVGTMELRIPKLREGINTYGKEPNESHIGNKIPCANALKAAGDSSSSITATIISMDAYIDRTTLAAVAEGFEAYFIEMTTRARRNGATKISHHNGRTGTPNTAAIKAEGTKTALTLERMILLFSCISPREKSKENPEVRNQTDAAMTGSVSKSPSHLPTITASVVRTATNTIKPVIIRETTPTVKLFRIWRALVLMAGDQTKMMTRTAIQKSVASCRVFRSKKLTIHKP